MFHVTRYIRALMKVSTSVRIRFSWDAVWVLLASLFQISQEPTYPFSLSSHRSLRAAIFHKTCSLSLHIGWLRADKYKSSSIRSVDEILQVLRLYLYGRRGNDLKLLLTSTKASSRMAQRNDAEEGGHKSGAIRKIRIPIRGNEGEFFNAPNSQEQAPSRFANRERNESDD